MKKASRIWRRTPPTIFPVCLASLALGLGWRNASAYLPIPEEIGDLLLGGATALYICAQMLYLAKLATRPGVLFEDMTTPAARGGVAASGMTMMLLAAALLPYNLSVPQVWWTGVAMQIAASAIVCHSLWIEAPQDRRFSPFMYLTFVGPIVGPIAGIPLGHRIESIILATGALAASTVVTLGLGYELLHKRPPPKLRPPLVIFLAPNCLFAIAFALLGFDWPFHLFYWTSWVTAVVIIALLPWITRAGFTPLWVSFTFPSAAFLNMQVVAIGQGVGQVAVVGTIMAMAVATPVVLTIAYRITMLWITGALAERTAAATA